MSDSSPSPTPSPPSGGRTSDPSQLGFRLPKGKEIRLVDSKTGLALLEAQGLLYDAFRKLCEALIPAVRVIEKYAREHPELMAELERESAFVTLRDLSAEPDAVVEPPTEPPAAPPSPPPYGPGRWIDYGS
jgi:hypothetical protein